MKASAKALKVLKKIEAEIASVDWVDKELRCNDIHMYLGQLQQSAANLRTLLDNRFGGDK